CVTSAVAGRPFLVRNARYTPEGWLGIAETTSCTAERTEVHIATSAPPVYGAFGGAIELADAIGRTIVVPFKGNVPIAVRIEPGLYQVIPVQEHLAAFGVSWTPDHEHNAMITPPEVHLEGESGEEAGIKLRVTEQTTESQRVEIDWGSEKRMTDR